MTDSCKLCGKSRELRNSHILPEFLYLNLYDENHRALRVEAKNPKRPRTIQKGLRERLLCDACEQRLSKYEAYAAPIIKEIPTRDLTADGRFLEPRIVDYAYFKLFQLSILWRISISSLRLFSQVNIGGYEEQIRSMLVDERPGFSHNFGSVMFVLPNTEHLHTIIEMPSEQHIDGRKMVKVWTGNLFWFFTITKFPKRHPIRDLYLSEAGELKLPLAPWSEDQVLEAMIRAMSAGA